MSERKPPAEELEKRVAWLRGLQERDNLPAADLYWCDCGLWTVAVRGTADVRCSCGAAPRHQAALVPDAVLGEREGRG